MSVAGWKIQPMGRARPLSIIVAVSGLKRRRARPGGDTGWHQAMFSSPVAVTANTTYVASCYAPNGRYLSAREFP